LFGILAKNCQHCDAPNPEGYFNCPKCGERASKPKWSINTIVRDTPMAKAIRQDKINFGTKDMGQHMKEIQKKNKSEANKRLHSSIKWDDKPVTIKS
jgi:RNA polymerase subunit RPABC4/transcription elongation factor Spt4